MLFVIVGAAAVLCVFTDVVVWDAADVVLKHLTYDALSSFNTKNNATGTDIIIDNKKNQKRNSDVDFCSNPHREVISAGNASHEHNSADLNRPRQFSSGINTGHMKKAYFVKASYIFRIFF